VSRERLLVGIGLLILLLAGCTAGEPEDAIRQVIRRGADLAERHDLGGLLGLTTKNFMAMPGRRDRDETKGILWMAFRYYEKFRIIYPEPEVDLEEKGRTASARVYFLIVRERRTFPRLEALYKDPQGWLKEVGEKTDLYRLDLDWFNEDGDWLVAKAHLEPFRGTGFERE